jgi:signal recognition particle receptor subunit beta
MAVFDVAHRRMCVRIVYDGPASSGKTTNARQLASAFASQRWGELDTPEEMAGRTLWFDWLQIRAGVVCGYPLICQIVTVPGQVALTPRRRKLLASADVVVFVCDSAEGALGPARTALALVEDLVREPTTSVPRILQANKQDRVDALDPRRVAEELGWTEGNVLGAVASEGMGVVDTFVSAVRVLSRSLEDRMSREGLRITATRVEGAATVLARLEATAIDPEDAVEMLLEEVAASLVVAPAEPAPDLAPASASTPPPALRAQLPTAHVPTGFVWPAHTGRATLEALEESGALAGEARRDGAGEARLEVLDHVLESSLRDRFDDVDGARQALVHAARERTQLEGLLVAGTVLAVQEARGGGFWLWRVAPRLSSFAERFAALGARERLELVDALAGAVALGAVMTVRRRVALDPSLDAFGLQGDAVRYGGRLAPCDAPDHAAGELLARIGDAIEALGAPRERFVAAVSRELSRRLGGDDAARSVTSALEVRAA